MKHVWDALDRWAIRLGILADAETSRRLDQDDTDIKTRDTNVTEFTRRRNRFAHHDQQIGRTA